MTWGNQNTDEEAASQLSAAWDAGVNFVDTAEAYPVPLNAETQGATDRAIAKWMSSTRQPRDGVILATKVCGYNERFTWFREDGSGTRVSAKQIVESVEASLKRLNTDYVDLLQIHWPDRYVPIFGSTRYDVTKEREDAISFTEQARPLQLLPRPLAAPPPPSPPASPPTIAPQCASQAKAMGELIKSGKVRHWGLSNETPLGVCEFVAACRAEGVPPPVSVQNSYSLLTRSDEAGLVSWLRRNCCPPSLRTAPHLPPGPSEGLGRACVNSVDACRGLASGRPQDGDFPTLPTGRLVEALRHHDVGYLPYSPLSAGVLTGKYAGHHSGTFLDVVVRRESPPEPPQGSRLSLFGGYMDRCATALPATAET